LSIFASGENLGNRSKVHDSVQY